MTPNAARKILAQWKREDAEATLRFDIARLLAAGEREGFGFGWPEVEDFDLPLPDEWKTYRGN